MSGGDPVEAVGPISRSVLAAILTLRSRGDGIPPEQAPLAELALELARQLDNGDLGMAVAAVSKELRATLAELMAGGDDDDDDPFPAWVNSLSNP